MASPAVAAGGDASNDVILGAGSGVAVGFGFLVGLAVGFGVGVGPGVAIGGGAVGWTCLGAQSARSSAWGRRREHGLMGDGSGASAGQGEGSGVAGPRSGSRVRTGAAVASRPASSGRPTRRHQVLEDDHEAALTRAAPIMSRANRGGIGERHRWRSGTTGCRGCGGGARARNGDPPGARWTGRSGRRRDGGESSSVIGAQGSSPASASAAT